ncbi:MAG: protein-export chaperone SecB [Betaproteobacteria bacterium]|jgi:preprotein translocase subunit SecB
MSTEPQSTPNPDVSNPSFQIQRIYLKDISLEQPNAPKIFLNHGEPQVQIQIDIQFEELQEGVYEVNLIGNVTTRVEDKVLFLIEAKQSGIFELRNIPVDQVEPMLSISCPTIIYPYLRSNISDLISRGGFQPIHLAEINFHQLYEERLAQAKATAESASTSSLPN